MRYELDPAVVISDGGRTLVGGSPRRLFRFSPAGARVLDAWRRAGSTDAESAAQAALVQRLVDAGAAHPISARPEAQRVDAPAVVVPVRDRPDALRRCLDALVASGVERIVVSDDGSVDSVSHRRVSEQCGAQYVRSDVSCGPAGARARGLAELSPSVALVAFVDSDIEVEPSWLDPLIGLFGDDRVALVAPRVRHGGDPSEVGTASDRYERANSPLDLGDRRAPIRQGTAVAYVPAAALVVRRTHFDSVGGFDSSMQVGEDVDLVWRLAAAGWRCRYEPASTVWHAGRSSVGALLRRRLDYGRSAAQLDRRHRGSVAAVRGGVWSYAWCGAVLARRPVLAAGVGLWSWNRLRASLSNSGVGQPGPMAASLVAQSHWSLAQQLGRATIRPWWPLALFGWAVRRRLGPDVRHAGVALGALSLVAPARRFWSARTTFSVATALQFGVLWFADEVAYSTGVWIGCVESARIGPLLASATGGPDGRKTRIGSSIRRGAAGAPRP